MSKWADMVEEDEESFPSLVDAFDKSKQPSSKAPRTSSVSHHSAEDHDSNYPSRENRYTSNNSRNRYGHQEREYRGYGENRRNERYSNSSGRGGGDRDRRTSNNIYNERKPSSGSATRGLRFVDHRASLKPKGEMVQGTVVTLRPDFGFAKVDSLKDDVFFHKR